MKIVNKIVPAFLAVMIVVMMASCPVDEALPTGSITPRPGDPYGAEDAPLPTFDITNLPSPEFWNSNGHYHNLPDLFTFADGTKVQTKEDWEKRRAEILKIIQYYEYGMMPAWPDNITWDDAESGNTITTVIHVTVGTMSRDFTVDVTLPDDSVAKKHNGKIPVMFQAAAANGFTNTQLNNAGYATAGLNENTLQPEGTYGVDGMTPQAGIVGELYNWQRDIDLPSCNIAYAWGMSVIIHVIEQGGFKDKLDPTGVMITGMSRYGKAAVVAGAMAESPSGQRVALTVSGSAGMGGPSIERFITSAGLGGGNVDPNYIETFNGAVGKKTYIKASPDSTNSSGTNSVIAVKSTEPYDEIYNGRDEVGWGFIQSHAEGRAEQGGWFSRRFQDFRDLHFGVDMDHDLSANPDLNRTKHGWLCTMPFDQHFLAALCAPNGFIFHDGYKTRRNNPEGQYLNYLAVKEVYEFLEKGPNVGIRLYNIPHSQPAYEFEDMANFADALFGFTNSTAGTNSQADVQADELPLFRQEAYPHDDPLSKWDYYRLNWARPGAKSIAQQVKEKLGE